MKVYGLIGKSLQHSFSPTYFAEKFKKEGIRDSVYRSFPLERIEDFNQLLQKENNLAGLNVTIPYKTQIIPFLDELSPQAAAIGAVNVIQFKNNQLIGHNTDVDGFQISLERHLNSEQKQSKALVLGTGGASKAVIFALESLKISYQLVSRNADANYTYQELNADLLKEYLILINTTPLGMFPSIETCPPIPYEAIGAKHLLFDLVYNPLETVFLTEGKNRGATIVNGLEMLHLQAEKAWAIWGCADMLIC